PCLSSEKLLLNSHPELYVLLNVGSLDDADSFFSSADSAFTAANVPVQARGHYGFSIDGEDDPIAVRDKLRTKLGTDANIAYGDGSSGCCGVIGDTIAYQIGASIALVPAEIVGQFVHLAPNVPTALQQAAYMRAAHGDFNMIAY